MGIFNSKLTNSARITKLLLKLQPYKFVVQVIKGKDNIVADSLSRIPWPVVVKEDSAAQPLALVGAEDEMAEPIVDDHEEIPPEQPIFNVKTITAAQLRDENLSRLIVALQRNIPLNLKTEPKVTQ